MPETISLNAFPNNLAPGFFRVAFASDGHTLIDATQTPALSAARALHKLGHPMETIVSVSWPGSTSLAPLSGTIHSAGRFP
jgi:hypothetical protein